MREQHSAIWRCGGAVSLRHPRPGGNRRRREMHGTRRYNKPRSTYSGSYVVGLEAVQRLLRSAIRLPSSTKPAALRPRPQGPQAGRQPAHRSLTALRPLASRTVVPIDPSESNSRRGASYGTAFTGTAARFSPRTTPYSHSACSSTKAGGLLHCRMNPRRWDGPAPRRQAISSQRYAGTHCRRAVLLDADEVWRITLEGLVLASSGGVKKHCGVSL